MGVGSPSTQFGQTGIEKKASFRLSWLVLKITQQEGSASMMIAPETAFGKARVILDRMVAFVEQASKDEVRTDCVERELFVMLLEMGRQLLTAFFAMAGDGNVGESWSWKGQTLWKLQDLKKKTYRSIFGVIGLFRHVYAVREGRSPHSAVDQRLGLPAGEQSYVLEDWLQRFCVQKAFGPAVNDLNDLLGTKTSKRTAERINQEMAEYVDSREDQCSELEDEGEILVVSADGKGVPMRSTLEQRMGLDELPWRRFQRKKQEEKTAQRATPTTVTRPSIRRQANGLCGGGVHDRPMESQGRGRD